MSNCFSCGKKCDPIENRCYGCHRIVCVSCVNKYDHMMNGEHGRRPTQRALDGRKRGAKSKSLNGIVSAKSARR